MTAVGVWVGQETRATMEVRSTFRVKWFLNDGAP